MLQAEVVQQHDEWVTPILTAQLADTKTLNEALKEIILAKEAEFSGEPSSRPNAICNTFSQLHHRQGLFDWPFNEIRALKEAIRHLAESYVAICPKDWQAANVSVRGWANIHRQGDWHGHHSHYAGGPEIAVGVYWVTVPAKGLLAEQLSGQLILFDPRGDFCPWRYKKIIEPVPGALLIHPAWLAHEVAPNRSMDLRISISFEVVRQTQ